MEIIGVVKDFHFQSMRQEVKPLFFRLAPESAWNVMVKNRNWEVPRGHSWPAQIL